jgi:hypothetical protein
MEKIGIRDSSYKESDSMNHAIQVALLQQELEANKRKLNELEKVRNRQSNREHFTGGSCGCESTEGMKGKKTKCNHVPDTDESLGFDNKKILLILVVILAAFCVIQYFSYKNEMKEMMMLLCTMLKSDNSKQQQVPQQQIQVPPVLQLN